MEFNNLNTDKRICGVIGNPLGHSLSPMMHNAGFKKLGLNYVYHPFEIPDYALSNTLKMLKTKNFRGLNVTHPFKIKILPFLDEIDALAAEIGAVNTVVNDGGTLTGYNTDAYGAQEALASAGVRVEDINGKILVVGAGGAARAVAIPIAKLSKKLIIANRTLERAEELCEKLNHLRPSSAETIKIEEIKNVIDTVELLINCTPVGMTGGPDGAPIQTNIINNQITVFDIVFSPMKTTLITAAQAAGAKVIFGYEMLINQGAKAFELWTGKTAPVDLMREVVLDELGKD
jgi:shikimate dehydrogenase